MTRHKAVPLQIGKLELKAGDCLVIKFPKPPQDRERDEIVKAIRGILPVGVKAMLFVGEIELTVIHPDDSKD